MIEYFSHDFHARSDPKLREVKLKYGLAGLGLYWCIVEMLYEENGYLPESIIPAIAYDERVDENMVNDLIDNFGLFVRNNGVFYSESALERLNVRNEKSEKAKKSAAARWEKPSKNANAMRTQCERNAIKEKKSKEKEIKENTPSVDGVVTRTREDTPAPTKRGYGKHQNLFLTDAEYAEIQKHVDPAYVDKVSDKFKKGNYRFDNHFEIIVQWAQEHNAYHEEITPVGTFDTDKAFEKALRRTMRKTLRGTG